MLLESRRNIQSNPRSSRIAVSAIAAVYIIASLQNLTIASIAGFSIKPIHILCILMLLGITLTRIHVTRTLLPAVIYLIAAIVISLPGSLTFGFDPIFANYILAIAILAIASTTLRRVPYSLAVTGLRVGASIVTLYSAFNILMQWNAVVYARTFSADSGARAVVDGLIYSGGINLEASWAALASAFFVRSPFAFSLYSVPTVFILLATSSRAATVIWLICAFLALLRSARRHILVILTAIVVFSGAVLYVGFLADFTKLNVVQRFLAIGSDPGSMGRDRLWAGALEAFGQTPIFGHGLGNGMLAVRQVTGTQFIEDNVHDLYLTQLLELGVLGVLLYVAMLSLTLTWLRNRLEAVVYLLAFVCASAVEFRGADTMFYLTLGILGASLNTISNVHEVRSNKWRLTV